MTYTVHAELTDGTFVDEPDCSLPTKKIAIQVAKQAAKICSTLVYRYHVCKDGQTIASFRNEAA